MSLWTLRWSSALGFDPHFESKRSFLNVRQLTTYLYRCLAAAHWNWNSTCASAGHQVAIAYSLVEKPAIQVFLESITDQVTSKALGRETKSRINTFCFKWSNHLPGVTVSRVVSTFDVVYTTGPKRFFDPWLNPSFARLMVEQHNHTAMNARCHRVLHILYIGATRESVKLCKFKGHQKLTTTQKGSWLWAW